MVKGSADVSLLDFQFSPFSRGFSECHISFAPAGRRVADRRVVAGVDSSGPLHGGLGRSGGAESGRPQCDRGRHLGAAARASAAASLGRGDFAAVLQDVSARPGPDEALFLSVRHRRVCEVARPAGRRGPARRHQLRLHGVSDLPGPRGRAGEDDRRVAAAPQDFTVDEEMVDRQGRGDLREDSGRGLGPLAEADQVRPAVAEGRQDRPQEGPLRGEDAAAAADAALSQFRQADAPDQQRRVAGDVSHLADDVVGSAHRLHVAGHAGELRDHDAAEAGRDRGFAAGRRRLHGGEADHPRRGRREGRPPQAGRQDPRRRPRAKPASGSTSST